MKRTSGVIYVYRISIKALTALNKAGITVILLSALFTVNVQAQLSAVETQILRAGSQDAVNQVLRERAEHYGHVMDDEYQTIEILKDPEVEEIGRLQCLNDRLLYRLSNNPGCRN